MQPLPPAVESLTRSLGELGWVTDVLVGGSLAMGDYVAGVSDLDLLAVTDGPVDARREHALVAIHRELDRAAPVQAGCTYVDGRRIADAALRHPVWTHGQLVRRPLSQLARAELARHGFATLGRPPSALFPAPTDDEVRAAARAEVTHGYWAWAVRRPWVWLDPVVADLGLTTMARARYTVETGSLLTKTAAIERVEAPAWLVDRLRARRRGERVGGRRMRTAWIAWRTTRRAVRILSA